MATEGVMYNTATTVYFGDKESPAEAYQDLVDFILERHNSIEIISREFSYGSFLFGDSKITIEFKA